MTEARQQPRDPIAWHALVAAAFLGLCLIRLTIPSFLYFDEVHYIPAARVLMALDRPANIEHPLLGKEILALGMSLLGDRALGWRLLPVMFGTLGLFAAMRALWFASCSRYASVVCGVLLITAFPLLVQSRIAMLDIFAVAFILLAYWAIAAALRENETARRRLAVAGVMLGLALGSKWNAAPFIVLPGLAFLAARLKCAGHRALFTRRCPPIRGVSLAEAALWLGVVPLAVYSLTYAPAFFYATDPVPPFGLIGLHAQMLELQGQVVEPHTYMSRWYEWVSDWRGIWYLYEVADGAQRGVLMIGNPLPMLAGLPAIAWCLWAGIARQRWDALGVAVLYLVGVLFWALASKPVQFYYHYVLPSCFLMAGLALALEELRQRGHRWIPLLTLGASAALFVYFYPILTAAPLETEQSFLNYTPIPSWQ
ncbi:phospholipid carrier-dependent glycosyltransferase [Altericroceibacterium xinjiangense]|uniref:phospholipid carrier-dependent glycosyltransferase n=1 Tax=Altericroceibacterium xinjiangense TaxID=762261 RepID=UPI000F7E9E90|nr:phospholipid carrier-dependent glycosyltransferase [Altericroceibacterium xinjiangense]